MSSPPGCHVVPALLKLHAFSCGSEALRNLSANLCPRVLSVIRFPTAERSSRLLYIDFSNDFSNSLGSSSSSFCEHHFTAQNIYNIVRETSHILPVLCSGREFEQPPGDGEGQGSLACCMGSQRVRHD